MSPIDPTLTDVELAREIAHARNRRDAFSAGREPADVLAALRALLAEQAARRERRHAARLGFAPDRQVTATARDAGRNVVHTVAAVYTDGTAAPVYRATRRSNTRYAYAICRWATDTNGTRAVFVERWSKAPRATGETFAVPVMSASEGDQR